jgi:hypothetical protein
LRAASAIETMVKANRTELVLYKCDMGDCPPL